MRWAWRWQRRDCCCFDKGGKKGERKDGLHQGTAFSARADSAVCGNRKVNKKSGLSPPSLPPKSATHQSLAHAGDFMQFPIRQKKRPILTIGRLLCTETNRGARVYITARAPLCRCAGNECRRSCDERNRQRSRERAGCSAAKRDCSCGWSG